MTVTLPIPDVNDVSHRALEAFAAEAYRAGRLSHPDLRRLLGFDTQAELDDFLTMRGISENCTASKKADSADVESRTDWNRLDNMTEAEIEEGAASDPDSAPIMTLEQMRRAYKPHPARIR